MPDSKALAIISDHLVEVIEIESDKQLVRYELSNDINSIDFDKNSGLVAIGLDGDFLYIYDRKGYLQKKILEERSSVTSIAFNNEGSLLAVGFKDGQIELRDTRKWEKVGKLLGHKKRVHSLAFAPNNKTLISVSDDLQTTYWDLNTQKKLKSFIESTDRVLSACFSMDGSLIGLNIKNLIIYYDSRYRRMDKRFLVIREIITGDLIRELPLPKDISAIAFYSNRRYIASAHKDKDKNYKVSLWDIYSGKDIKAFYSEKPVISLDFSNDGKMLAYATHNKVIISAINTARR